MKAHTTNFLGTAARAASCALALGVLGACSMNGSMSGGPGSGIGFREARFAEISAMREYRSCRDEALALDSKARGSGSSAQYLQSAKLIAKCESALGPDMAGIARQERMRTYALGVQNRLKGGDVAGARTGLEKFRAAFAGNDLYYPDGTSFTETMELVLGLRDSTAVGGFSLANVNGELKAELRRARYWKRH
jgi:hypothetical protein